MEPGKDIPLVVNGHVDNFDLTCTLDRADPDLEKLKIVIVSQNADRKYEGNYTYENFIPISTIIESIQEAH